MRNSFISLSNAIRGMIALGLVALLLVIVQSCSQPKTALEQFAFGSVKKLTSLENPPSQPQGSFKDVNGAELKLSDYHGKTVLLNVWATWCAPCIAEMPALDQLQSMLGGESFQVVTISMDRTAEEASAWLRENNIQNLGGWHDSNYTLSSNLRLPGLPTSIIYDKNGREIARIPGEVEWISDEALLLITKATEYGKIR